MDFSKKLRKAMEELGITQTQVVCMTGLAKSCISQYLSGKNVPTEERMQEMASSLGLRADYFKMYTEKRGETVCQYISADSGLEALAGGSRR